MPRASAPRGFLFAHSAWDALLVALSLLEAALLTLGVVALEPLLARYGPGPTAAALSGLGLWLVFLNCTNFQCISHNFLHNPFFRWRPLNRLFGVINTLGLGVPQCLYRVHHLNHHQYGNDRIDPATGTTRDRSSTWRCGRDGREEPAWRYSLLGPWRTEFGFLIAGARRREGTAQVVVESLALVLFVAGLGWLSWRGLLLFWLPVWYLGEVAAFAENWLEHHGAVPGDRLTDSVSSYGRLYNAIWFNNGYHQEHHWRPQVHWTQVRALRAEMRPEDQRRVVPWAHWVNWW